MSQPRRAAAPALPSATVVLLRDGSAGPEVLMVLRHATTSFGASYVFPGGLLHDQDGDVASRCIGFDDAAASRRLDLDHGGLAYFSAAIRELFEEAGVLLALDEHDRWTDADALSSYRDGLNDGSESWPAFLARYDLRLVCDALIYFSFWITPREAKKRFSTRFFMARLPDGQDARHCGTEVTDSRWVSPSVALAESRDGRIEVPHPTIRTLTSLAPFSSTDELLDWATVRCGAGVECFKPAIVMDGDQRRVVMPGDPDYPDYPGYTDEDA